jgi:hypothetical protein
VGETHVESEGTSEPDKRLSAPRRVRSLSTPPTNVLGATPWEAKLLELQRTHGNRVVRALAASGPRRLARDGPRAPQPTQSPQPIVAGGQDQIIITDAVGAAPANPELFEIGGFSWSVRFRLPTPARADGWIVQKIQKFETMLPQMTLTPTTTPYQEYWEGWKVLAGDTIPAQWREGYARTRDDQFAEVGIASNRPAAETHGQRMIRGLVRFQEGPPPFPVNSPDDNPYWFDTMRVGAPALPASYSWPGTGTLHEAQSWWDVRPPHPTNVLVLSAGRTARRTIRW